MLRRTADTESAGGRGAAVAALLLVLAASPTLPSLRSSAWAADAGTTLEGSGIHYPGGFDPNTVGEIQGRASGIAVPRQGPVRFRLDTGKDRYTVLASPPWYWDALRIDLPEGSEVLVRGSKTLGRDMNLYVIAQEIRFPAAGKSWVLRDEDGFPRWRGQRGNGIGGGAGGGMGGSSPMRRGGGAGGPGGMGGRRR